MGLLGNVVRGAVKLGYEHAQRQAAQGQQHQRQQQQQPEISRAAGQSPLGTFQDFKNGFREGFVAGQTLGDRLMAASGNVLSPTQAKTPTSPSGAGGYGQPHDQPNAFAETAAAQDEAASVEKAHIDQIRRMQENLAAMMKNMEDQASAREKQAAEQARLRRDRQQQQERQRRQAEQQAQAEAWAKGQEAEEQRARQARQARQTRQSHEAAAKAETLREQRQWRSYEKAWEIFESLTVEQACCKTPSDMIPWPFASGRCSVHVDDAVMTAFFLESSSLSSETPAAMLAKERKRWHPDKMNQKVRQKGKEIDEDTLKAVTAISQILNALCSP